MGGLRAHACLVLQRAAGQLEWLPEYAVEQRDVGAYREAAVFAAGHILLGMAPAHTLTVGQLEFDAAFAQQLFPCDAGFQAGSVPALDDQFDVVQVAAGAPCRHGGIQACPGRAGAQYGVMPFEFGAGAGAAGEELYRRPLHDLGKAAFPGVEAEGVVTPGNAVVEGEALTMMGAARVLHVAAGGKRNDVVQSQRIVQRDTACQLRCAHGPAAGIVGGEAAPDAFGQRRRLAQDAHAAGVGLLARVQLGHHVLARQALHLLDALFEVAQVQHIARARRKGIAPGAPCAVGRPCFIGPGHGNACDAAYMQADGQHAIDQVLLRQRHSGGDIAEFDQLRIERRGDLPQPGDAGALTEKGQRGVGQPAKTGRVWRLQMYAPDDEAGLLDRQSERDRRTGLRLERIGRVRQPMLQVLRALQLAAQAFVYGLGRRDWLRICDEGQLEKAEAGGGDEPPNDGERLALGLPAC